MKKITLLMTSLMALSISAEQYLMNIESNTYKNSIVVSSVTNSNNTGGTPPPPTQTYASCLEIFNAGLSIGDGVYSINNGSKDYDVFCNMTTNGGGWTLVLAQFESNPATNWNEGIQPDYDPTLNTGTSFTLNTSEMPTHTAMAYAASSPSQMNVFGAVFSYVYTTGNIPVTLITSTTGQNYQIHRDTAWRFGNNDPEFSGSSGNPQIVDVLTIDITGRNGFSFAFAPNDNLEYVRGYGYNGDTNSSSESFAWAIWVR